MRIPRIGIICCIFLLQSCYAILGRSVGLHNKTAKITTLDVDDKDVAFLGMMHLGKRQFYKSVSKKIATYQKKGYVMYLEGKADNQQSVKVKVDTTAVKKLRKIMNVDLTQSYVASPNETMQKLIQQFNLIGQPSYDSLGVTNYRFADVGYLEFLDYFEERNGTIVLDSCDIQTPLGSQYKCTPLLEMKRKFRDQVILGLRNQELAKKILDGNDRNILVIYGKAHLKGLKEELEKQQAAAKK